MQNSEKSNLSNLNRLQLKNTNYIKIDILQKCCGLLWEIDMHC